MDGLKIIGISIKTTNANGQAMHDLGKLWQRFYAENVPGQIPDKAGNEIYTIYTDYESDYTGSYCAMIGLKANTLDDIPEGLTGRTFEAQHSKHFVAKGKMPDAVAAKWKEIWQADKELNRTYLYDVEVYGERAQQGENSEVDIFIGVR